MTTELWMLMAGVGILAAGIVSQGIAGLIAFGPLRQAGTRDEPREPDKLMGRTTRAVQNQIESLALFTPIVLIAHMLDANTATSAFGATIYAMSRAIYMPVYWLGVPFVRTLLFTGGLVGTVMVALPIFSS